MNTTKSNAVAERNAVPFSFTELKRSAGILLHISSLPSQYGIGDMGPEAYRFADFLGRSKQSFWQVLPLNPTTTGSGHSPYSASSAMAGNPLLISPDKLVEEGWLQASDLSPYQQKERDKTDYEEVEKSKCSLLEKAFKNYSEQTEDFTKEIAGFIEQEAYWLHDFALFSVLLQTHENKPWYEWEHQYKHRDAKALQQFETENKMEIDKINWQQFVFAKQWSELKRYCNKLNIRLFGDMPIYVGYNSSDVWANQAIFSLDEEGRQVYVSGTPPDDFDENGQLWGMPVFNWDVLAKQNYRWWIDRFRRNLAFFDVLRLDHFRGFESYWQIPAGAKTALEGKWVTAPGKELFSIVKKELGETPFVAEDLGEIDEAVYQLRDEFQLPGMEVLTFAFGEEMSTNVHIPHNHIPLCVVYTGTHDTNTLMGWFASQPKQTKANLLSYTGLSVNKKNVCGLLCRMAYASVSKLAMLPMQDVLELGEEARMNSPSSAKNNWRWRLLSSQLNKEVEAKLAGWCETYNRLP